MRRAGIGLVRVAGQAATTTQVETLLSTQPGDLINDPSQGLKLDDLLFLNATTVSGVIAQRIHDQFAAYLPTIALDSLTTDVADSRISVSLVYRDTQTGRTEEVTVSHAVS